MNITFKVDDNFVGYYEDAGWSKGEIRRHCGDFVEKVLLNEEYENRDLVFMTKFDDYIQGLVEEE